MSFRLRIGPLLGLAIIAVPHAAVAGAWTLPAGESEMAVIGTWTTASRVFDAAGNLTSTARTTKYELQGFYEYGATDRFTVMLNPGLQHVEIAAPVNATRTGLGYFEFGGRYRLFGGSSWVLSAQATLRAPGAFEPINAAAIGYSDPEVDFRALFGYGTTIADMPAFFDVQLAQRFRAASPPDEFRADLTFGIRPYPSWLLLVQSLNVISEGSAPPVFPDYAYHKLQLSVVYDVTPGWSLQVGGFTSIAGRNALQENGMLLGAWYRFGAPDPNASRSR
jgi:hypothetical protein